jgi:TonB family protein
MKIKVLMLAVCISLVLIMLSGSPLYAEEPYHIDDLQFFSGSNNTSEMSPLDSRDFIKAISGIIPELEAAYKTEYQTRPDLGGEVVVSFMIDTNGSVYDVYIKSSQLGNSKLEDLVVSKFQKLKFDCVSDAQTHLLVPLVFEQGTVVMAK